MHLIHHHLHLHADARPRIPLHVDRNTLAKRRWRGVAADGEEFGFDLEHSLDDGEVIFAADDKVYVVAQKPEPVLKISLSNEPDAAARLGWLVGNLHFQIEVGGGEVRVVDDPAVRQMLEREQIAFTAEERVFHPLGGGHSHAH